VPQVPEDTVTGVPILADMKKEWVLTQDAFDGLLDWLDADRNLAGSKYEAIRLRLIKIFTCRGCAEAEELADETINRVSARVVEIASQYDGDPARYFYGVSHKVHLEYLRKSRVQQPLVSESSATGNVNTPTTSLADNIEPEYECLEQCLNHLPPENRDLVVRYYQQEKQAKIEHRKLLATELGIAVNALRIRAHRIRLALQQCVQTCLEQQPAH
jgi:DNA-directed RNA polymerase specialized sigma24 family protein